MTTKKKSSGRVVEQTPRGTVGIAGKIEISDDVIATIAGVAARQIPGINSLGRSWFSIFSEKPSDGVVVEVGQEEAAVDLEVIIDYGCDIRKVAGRLRHAVAEAVDRMSGKRVVEVNLKVIDVIGLEA